MLPWHKPIVVACSTAILLQLSGCAVGGKSFSIDSNSRVPFFGLELKERKSKGKAPAFDSISRTAANRSRIETISRPNVIAGQTISQHGERVLITSHPSDETTAVRNQVTTLAESDTNSVTPSSIKASPACSIPLAQTPAPLTQRLQAASSSDINFY